MDRGQLNRYRRLRALAAPLLAAFVLLASAAAAQANTIVVNTTGDPSGTGDCLNAGQCSLRQAVGSADSGDTVQLPAGAYTLTQGTDIDIAKSLTIEGDTTADTTIDGSQNAGNNEYGETARILRVDYPGNVTIEDLTLTGGDDAADENCLNGCETLQENGGGALFNNDGSIGLTGVAFTNDGGGLGGAISTNGGSVGLTDVSFTDDSGYIGGALFARGGTVTGNGVTFYDDAPYATDNAAAYLYGGTASFTNTTVADNGGASSRGGGIDNGGATLTLINDTLSGNVRGALLTDQGASTTVENTIIGAGFSDGVDFACIAPGHSDDINDRTTANAVTTDGGDNIDQDGHCDLSGPGDVSGQDPMLVPIADNGGPTLTQALLAGSPALGDPATSNCPAVDQRGDSRPDGKCDTGAFEAILHGPPDATTGDATNITDSSADLAATINLDGEAGGFHFVYGTSPTALTSTSPVAAAGVVSSDTPETETLSYLSPGTTYYYEAAADNSTASTTASNIEQFTTDAGPPVISNVNVESVTDTTAKIDFSIDPQGADTTYFVEYGPDTNYSQDGQQTQPVDIGSTPGAQDRSVTLTGLDPDSSYDFQVVASNSVQQDVGSGDNQFNTDQQITGEAGSQVTVTDTEVTDDDCPSASDTTVDWGDDSSDNSAQIQCSGGGEDETQFTLTDTHTYTSPGHYLIQIEYGDLDATTDEYAEISPSGGITNTGLPVISGLAQQGETLNTTNGSWNGGPDVYHYQWLDCDQNGGDCSDTGDDVSSYTLTGSDVGHTIEVTVTAANDSSQADATSNPTAQVTPSAPSNTQLPVITGTAQQGQILSTTNGNWDGTPSGFAYQWQDCDANGQSCTDAGTDANTYTLGANDVGHTIDVLVTATNAGGHTQVASNRTAVVLAPSSPPASNPSPPTVATIAPTVTVTSAGFSGSVTPNGLPTQAYFLYGLDPKYSGGGPVEYDLSTQPQSVGSDFTSHAIGPVAVAGLLPNALYHVRLVASNSDGVTFGPDVTFTTEAAPAPSAPTLGKTFNVTPVSGFVLIKIDGKFVPLTGLDQIPSGSEIDARHGSLELITSNGQKGKTQHGTFGGAIFKLTQERSGPSKGLVNLTIVEGAFKGAPSYALCSKPTAGDASAAAVSSRVLQLLRASAHGKFRTSGRYSAATVRGTIWTVADRCDGTLTHDVTDSVAVKDFVHHKTIILHAGQSYLARRPRP